MKYSEALAEWNRAVEEASDEELVKYGIGCDNATEDMPFGGARCKYNKKGHCIRGAVLTSTLNGAHPNDCPLRRIHPDDIADTKKKIEEAGV